MHLRAVAGAAGMLLASTVVDAQARLHVGLAFGSSSDFNSHNQSGAITSSGRALTIGIPVRYRLLAGRTLDVDALGAVEWGPALRGTTAWLTGLESSTRVTPGSAVTFAAFFGWIRRQNVAADANGHVQLGIEPGLRFKANVFSIGLSYRLAWVQNVSLVRNAACPRDGSPCFDITRSDAPGTVSYDRAAIAIWVPIGFD